MSNNKQSSVEWLIEELRGANVKGDFIFNGVITSELIEQAKAMHKAEIIEARTNGMWYVKEKYGEVRTNKDYYDQIF